MIYRRDGLQSSERSKSPTTRNRALNLVVRSAHLVVYIYHRRLLITRTPRRASTHTQTHTYTHTLKTTHLSIYLYIRVYACIRVHDNDFESRRRVSSPAAALLPRKLTYPKFSWINITYLDQVCRIGTIYALLYVYTRDVPCTPNVKRISARCFPTLSMGRQQVIITIIL